jgi:hypothetical protein
MLDLEDVRAAALLPKHVHVCPLPTHRELDIGLVPAPFKEFHQQVFGGQVPQSLPHRPGTGHRGLMREVMNDFRALAQRHHFVAARAAKLRALFGGGRVNTRYPIERNQHSLSCVV